MLHMRSVRLGSGCAGLCDLLAVLPDGWLWRVSAVNANARTTVRRLVRVRVLWDAGTGVLLFGDVARVRPDDYLLPLMDPRTRTGGGGGLA
jgi:hypothetical protein